MTAPPTESVSSRSTPAEPSARDPGRGAVSALVSAVVAAAGDIKLAHTVFALPFAVLAAAMAFDPAWSVGRLVSLLGLVIGCMFFARTWAMLFNRLVDAGFDAENPRTVGRAIPAGRLSAGAGWAIAGASAFVFCGLCALFWVFFGNHWPTLLAVPALVWIALYSLTKRFTWLCHVFLGGALAASPLCAAVAVRPEVLAEAPSLWWLAGMVAAWVAGFDVIYALQDTGFDRERGLRSIPATLGVRPAIWLSRVLHLIAAACLVLAWSSDPRFGAVFGLGVVLTLGLLVTEHAVLARRGEAGLDLAFFTLNGIVSVVLGVSGVIDVLMGAGS